MPVHRGHDSKGPYYQFGKSQYAKKYHYIPYDKISRGITLNKAKKQGRAIEANKMRSGLI